MQESEELYCTAKEARQELGIDEHKFQYWIKKGIIQGYKIGSNRQNKYRWKDIRALAKAIDVIERERMEFTRSRPGDQEEEMQIGIRCFGAEYITPLPERIAFQLKNEYAFWSLKVDDRVVGYISMFRFSEQFLDDLLTGRHIERDITLKEILRFTRHEPFDVYIDVMAVDPLLPASLRKVYAFVIVERFAAKVLDLRANGYEIGTLYTITATPEGDALVRGAGFQLMPGKSLVVGRIAYKFPLDEEGIKRLEHYSRRGGNHVTHSDAKTETHPNR